MNFRNRNFRRGLVLVNSMLEAFGRNLPLSIATRIKHQSNTTASAADPALKSTIVGVKNEWESASDLQLSLMRRSSR
jgi:hypothetical protein